MWRSRFKGDSNWRSMVSTGTRKWPGNPDLVFSSPSRMPPKYYEHILDEIGPFGSMKECHHVKCYTEDGEGIFSETIGEYTIENNGKHCVAGIVDLRPFIGPATISIGEDVLEAFNKRAIEAMKPTIELAMDMPTFITELGSLPDLFKSGVLQTLFGNRQVSKNLKSALQKPNASKEYLALVKSKIEKYKGENLAKSLAGDFLNLQFGWLPTLADAKALYKTISTIEKQLDRLFDQQGKVFTSHYTEMLKVPEREERIRIEPPWPDSVYVTTLEHTIKVTATLCYTRFRYPQGSEG